MTVEPVAVVRSPRRTIDDGHWGDVEATIELCDGMPAESLSGLDAFSHAEIVFLFDQLEASAVVRAAATRATIRGGRASGFSPSAPERGPIAWARRSSASSRARVRGCAFVALTPSTALPCSTSSLSWPSFYRASLVQQPAWSKELMADYW